MPNQILGPTSNTLAIVLPIVIIGLVLIALIVIVIIIVALVLRRRGTGTYSPQQAETEHGVQLKDNKPNEESAAKQRPQAENEDIGQTP